MINTIENVINRSIPFTSFKIRTKFISTFLFFLPLLISPFSQKAHGEMFQNNNQLQPIQVEITTHPGDNQTFMEGDTISFYISLDSDAYILLIYENASGQLIQIIPNDNKKSNYYKSGLFIAIPDKNDKFHFKVQPPFGPEILWVFASGSQLSEIKGNKLSNGMKQLGMDISEIKSEILQQAVSRFGEAKLTFQTAEFENKLNP